MGSACARSRRAVRQGAGTLCVAALVGALAASPAAAAPGPPAPPVTYYPVKSCIDALARPSTVSNGVSWGQQALQFTSAWQFSEGAGVKVAVIDTGVNRGAEFGSRLRAGADLVLRDDKFGAGGLHDCDGHGTLVAGIIAASPDPKSGFTGVAPKAIVYSIRQTSANYNSQPNSDSTATAAGTRQSLATAIDYAVKLGVRVINISLADCQTLGNANNATLTGAVTSAIARGVVIVSAAGNLSSDGGPCSKQNDPNKPAVTAATPADLEGVIAVASVNQNGTPSAFSLAGPWVTVAAPGTQIISSNPYPGGTGQVNEVTTQSGTNTIQGTSFAAPYVTGLVALLLSLHPSWTPAEVTKVIEQTAAHPASPGGRNWYVGYGLVDPVAALTASLPTSSTATRHAASALPVQPIHHASTRSERIALWGTLIVIGLLAGLGVLVATIRHRARRAFAT